MCCDDDRLVAQEAELSPRDPKEARATDLSIRLIGRFKESLEDGVAEREHLSLSFPAEKEAAPIASGAD